MKHKEIKFNAATTDAILRNLCATLKANRLDYVCNFDKDHYIVGIKCGKHIIDRPLIITTGLLFTVTDDKNISCGLYDTKYLLKLLIEAQKETKAKMAGYNPTPYEKGTTDLIEKGWKMKEELKQWEDENG